jgi:hypothetical protein
MMVEQLHIQQCIMQNITSLNSGVPPLLDFKCPGEKVIFNFLGFDLFR